jgi:hypothetical protein
MAASAAARFLSSAFIVFSPAKRLSCTLFRTPETTVPAFAGTVFEAFRTGGWSLSISTAVPAAQRLYFFFAAFFFVAFFFAAFFLVAILDLHVGLIRGGSIYMVDGIASKLYAHRHAHCTPLMNDAIAPALHRFFAVHS